MKAVTEKERKRKKRCLIDVQFSTNKNLATTQDRQTLQNSDEKRYCHPTFGVFYKISRKQRLLVETL